MEYFEVTMNTLNQLILCSICLFTLYSLNFPLLYDDLIILEQKYFKNHVANHFLLAECHTQFIENG